jgi:DNA-binding response OmpR family regulator
VNAPADGLKIMIIEDEFLVAAMLADALEDAGFTVAGQAASVSAALQLVEVGGFDCAVLDWNLDGARSDTIARALMARGVPFVISTGYGSVPAEFAAQPILPKPCDPAVLVTMLAGLRA